MKKILAIGEDFALLGTRASLLSKFNATVTCCSSREFTAHLENDSFDLVILCHSLQHSARLSITKEIYRRWPGARILLLAAADYQPSALECDVDAVVMALEPDQLLRTVTVLLGKPPARELGPRLVKAYRIS